MSERQTAQLDQWFYLSGSIFGNVFGHPRFEDGTFVRTSEVQEMGEDWARTRNTDYELLAPRDENAKKKSMVAKTE